MAQLDLIYSEATRYYEAPAQVRADGGILVIDDFGRQQISPRDLLNRWVVPFTAGRTTSSPAPATPGNIVEQLVALRPDLLRLALD